MLHEEGNDREEEFYLPNGHYIKIDYGAIDFKGKYIPLTKRFNAIYRRSILYDDNLKIISQVIENNPDYIDDNVWLKGPENGLLFGNELEKIIHFDDGKIAKVEYWITPEKREENFGRYETKFRRVVLFDEEGDIISEVIEDNPNYRRDGAILKKTDFTEEELEELSKLII